MYGGQLNVGSEWNRLLYPLSHHTTNNQNFYYGYNVGSKIPSWASYGQEELGFKKNDYGTRQWCQETTDAYGYRLYRGDFYGVSCSFCSSAGDDDGSGGWRPALDFIPQ